MLDIVWLIAVWSDWWNKILDHGLVWIKLQRLHSLGIVLNIVGIGLKSVIIFCVYKADRQNLAEEKENEVLLSRQQIQ